MMKFVSIVVLSLVLLPGLIQAKKKKENERPNVVFIISDQHKKDALGCYGDELVITPNIDALAKEGVRLTNCYVAAPVCAPSRAALITGMYPFANGAPYHKAPMQMTNGKVKHLGSGFLRETGYHEGVTTIGAAFQANGYITASPGKMHVHGELQKNVDEDHPDGNDLGWDEINTRYYTHFPGGHYQDEVGEDAYQRYRQFKKYAKVYKGGPGHLNEKYEPTLVKKDEDNFDMVVARKSVEFIKKRGKDGENFFLHVGFEKPHPPFTTTQKYLDMYNPADFTLPETATEWHGKGKYPWLPDWIHSGWPNKYPGATKNIIASYYACVTQVDDMVGRVVNALKEEGLYDNTIIIYTTDHGEHLFEHGLRGKHCMYEDAVNVPFIISYPKAFPKAEVNDMLFSFVDVMPTLCELTGTQVPETAQGISIVDNLKNGTRLLNRPILSEYRSGNYNGFKEIKNLPSRMFRVDDYKFIYTHGIISQLYNVVEDPDELSNLVLDPAYQDMARDFCFHTLVDKPILEYQNIDLSIKYRIIKWQAFDQAESYSVYYAPENNPGAAKMMVEDLTELSYKVPKEGFYWVMAKPKYTRTSPRLGDVPVYLEEYTYQLPISDAVEFVPKNKK
ncbi:sulfatase family protein [Carboxylicivirga marina]|uniref:Sulfatase-like hydrolase/transferase n=1 Tax=Carboxylicivirga marina TaxID=2800988 RepID=A0ABS1HEZ6_9BACT|nr:sulfatase-like hydrolase/transferase [Carboxylicivirga marina]MBK3516206.1 sulfatase-like hydrolase/transferase [Carboxylicivirga marina]